MRSTQGFLINFRGNKRSLNKISIFQYLEIAPEACCSNELGGYKNTLMVLIHYNANLKKESSKKKNPKEHDSTKYIG